MMLIIVICAVIGCINNNVNGDEYFSAISDMEKLLDTQHSVITFLRKQINNQKHLIKTLKLMNKKYIHEYKNAISNVEQYLSNPVNAYLLLKHLTIDWKNVKNLIAKEAVSENLIQFEKDTQFPNDADMDGAASGLGRLQNTYNLEISQLTKNVLKVEDCYDIGRRLFREEHFVQSIVWLQEAADRWQRELLYYKNDQLKINILDHLAISHYKEGNIFQALNITNDVLTRIPTHRKALGNRAFYQRELQKGESEVEEEYEQDELGYLDDDTKKIYKELCRGEISIPPKTQKDLKCRYIDHSVPFLKLAPFKREELYLDPRIYVFHDIINDEEIEEIKKITKTRFERSEVEDNAVQHVRVSKNVWLSDNDHKVVKNVNQRVQHMTQLTMDTAEPLQVVNYGIGGYYGMHFDSDGNVDWNDETGDRISTMLFYMSNVEHGGGTVFPHINVTVLPEKGSALYWYNLRSNAELDKNTLHASCPVLAGSKLSANKWIRERGQELVKPCPLDKELPYS